MSFRNTGGRFKQSVLGWLAVSSMIPISQPALAGPFTDVGHPAGAMTAWATTVDEVIRGPLDLAQPELGLAFSGLEEDVLGEASLDTTDVLSLGDGGSITVYLESGISNGPADDFAVFENGFFDSFGLFAELAFVEVASNGVDYARFEVETLNIIPVLSFETLDPTDYFGLAGRHPVGFGTGFDLAELAFDPLVQSGTVNLLDIRYVRLTDVVGDGSTFDVLGNAIFDPYPTAFGVGGFDLDAVGVIHVPEPGFLIGLLLGSLALFLIGRRRNSTTGIGGASRSLPLLLALVLAGPASALTATFDDLGLGVESYENGANLSGGYTSGGIFFENNYVASYDGFSAFAASTTTDTTTPGFSNQFSAIAGGGAAGSAGFGIFYSSGNVVLPSVQTVAGGEFTNTTYAALSMRDGDSFAKQFGGESGMDPDFFRLVVEGIDLAGASTGIVELLLADYRFEDSSLDYILDQWTYLDLSGLGLVKELSFSFESSDVGGFGINTPVYFAIDNLTTIPEPGTALLMGLGLAGLAWQRKDRR
jgi:hypothetical protein